MCRTDAADIETNTPACNAGKGTASRFSTGVMEFDISAGAGYGAVILGSTQHHHLALGTASLGWMISDPVATNHWYRGNWEILVDLIGGIQWHPGRAYFVGGGPEFRYNFMTGTRWVPFFSAGAGLTATDIRDGDLSTTFEFNLHTGPGVHYFLNDNMAITAQFWLLHLSNAGMEYPNLGVNSLTCVLGATWFF